jgi:hypothetical protein
MWGERFWLPGDNFWFYRKIAIRLPEDPIKAQLLRESAV